MADINSIVEQLSELTVLEAADLAKALEQKKKALAGNKKSKTRRVVASKRA